MINVCLLFFNFSWRFSTLRHLEFTVKNLTTYEYIWTPQNRKSILLSVNIIIAYVYKNRKFQLYIYIYITW